MSDETESDAEWLALLSDFRRHFWAVRVPVFWQVWAQASPRAAADWGMELRSCVHGLAGVAGLVGHPATGEHARLIERHWHANDADEETLRRLLDGLADELRALAPTEGQADA